MLAPGRCAEQIQISSLQPSEVSQNSVWALLWL